MFDTELPIPSTAAEGVAIPVTGGFPALALPESLSVETATLGRQPNNDGDNSGAMWFE